MRTGPKPERCAVCQTHIEQRSTGRPRRICESPECLRAADAERRRLRRRRAVALPSDGTRYEQNRGPAPRGGHEPLLRRLARRLAASAFPRIVVTAAELDALERALQAGAVTPDDVERIAHGHPPTAYPPLGSVASKTRDRLLGALERNAAHDPIGERHRQLMADLRNDPARALRVFGTTNEALLARLTLRLLRSDPDGRLGLLITDDEADARLEDAGLVPDGRGGWVRRR
jgi:hypothetical protein